MMKSVFTSRTKQSSDQNNLLPMRNTYSSLKRLRTVQIYLYKANLTVLETGHANYTKKIGLHQYYLQIKVMSQKSYFLINIWFSGIVPNDS